MAFLYCWGIFTVSHIPELHDTLKYHVGPKSMKIIGGCCLFNKGIMDDSLVIRKKSKQLLRKSSKKQVQDWLPMEHPGVQALIWALLSLKEKKNLFFCFSLIMTEYRKLICFIVNVMSDMNPVLLKSIQAICFFFLFQCIRD